MLSHEAEEGVRSLSARADGLMDDGRYGEAAALYRSAIGLDADNHRLYNNLAVALFRQGKIDDAVEAWRRSIGLMPESIEALLNLAACYTQHGRAEDAVALYQDALARSHEQPALRHGLARALLVLGRVDEAEHSLADLVSTCADHSDGLIDYGNLLRARGCFEQALEHYAQAARVDPASAIAANNVAVACYDLGRLDDALTAFRAALERDPYYYEAHFNLSATALLKGDYPSAWAHFEFRQHKPEFRCPDPIRRKPRWRGEDLVGKTLLVYTEQGYGDAIQFARFLLLLRDRVDALALRCHSALARLFRESFPFVDVTAAGDPWPTFDCQVPLLSLPYELGVDMDALNALDRGLHRHAYLDTVRTHRFAAAGDCFRVGIAWRGNPANGHDPERRVPLALFERFTHIEGVRLVRLQKDDPDGEWAGCEWRGRVEDISAELGDFADTAAAINGLDLVLTVDTSLAHLAGAMGCKAWVMLCRVPHWPFGLDSQTTPWYPGLRLFRQSRRGDWADVLNEVEEQLRCNQY